MYSSLLKEAELGYPVLQNVQSTFTKKIPEGLQSSQEEKYPEISMQTFFEFMRTAYQVNDSFEELASVLSANSEINWTALAKTNLNLNKKENSPTELNSKINSKGTETVGLNQMNHESIVSPNCETEQSILISRKTPDTSRHRNSETKIVPSTSQTNHDQNKTIGKIYEQKETEDKKVQPEEIKKKKNPSNAPETKEHLLATLMKKKLSDVLHEGLLDSVLPYMLPKRSSSQPIIKKPLTNPDIKKSISTNNVESKSSISILNKDKDKNKQKKPIEAEVEIHVCDEAKNIKKDFRCPQKLLIQKMSYFADVTAGQKLEEMDISVHCDIVIFDWLMRWVKKDIIKISEWPVLEASNVIPIMVSASFLQMEPLLESCLTFCYNNMSEVLKTSTILSCLNDSLLTRLASLFSNVDVETIKDKKDKIQSRLFCKLIMSLADPNPDNKRGHFSSLATLFKCGKCGKNIVRSVSNCVPCIPSAMRLDNEGNLHNYHTRDSVWNLNEYISTLRAELKSWRKVYWRLWGDCHFMFCHQCGISFPINQMNWCSYHPEAPQFFALEHQRTTPFPLGRYPCCSQRAFRFEAFPNNEGCRFREHSPLFTSLQDEQILIILTTYRETIILEPPELFFPEKITRLVARDSSIPPGKLICKETMWWEGIELVPPRAKLGLLGKIWCGSGLRKPCAPSQKVSRKIQQATDVSSSSETESDDDNAASGYEYSSFEESFSSEESKVWPSVKTGYQKSKNHAHKRSYGVGSWSANLIVRYNQDNQRDFEEKAATQMIALLTKKISFEYGLLSKSYPHGKTHGYHWNNTPLGGTYVKLEAEFLEKLHASKSKNNPQTKGAMRNKSAKIN